MAITALHTAATGMQAMSVKIDVIANNLANADTPGFKAARVNFQDLLYQTRAQPGVQTSNDTQTPLPTQVGLGVAVSNTQSIHKQGSAILTGNSLDLMIEGDGFFQIQFPDGSIGYTRAGNFVRNSQGELVLGNNSGYRLRDTPQIPADIPDNKVSIGKDGRIVAIQADGTANELAQIRLARFANPSGLLQYGSNVFLPSPASGTPIEGAAGEQGIGTITQSTLELSTTEAVTELVELIKTQRVFQINSQTIQAADESLQVVANLRR
ncbi:Flagellar basal-body rod protein FlgG [Phycisphaerae bacterium RAS1]|nr:Flagellar basal-body rod protein FlgG [Phycisphaerae bacterium RAS1]